MPLVQQWGNGFVVYREILDARRLERRSRFETLRYPPERICIGGSHSWKATANTNHVTIDKCRLTGRRP